jgi:hypothetical protein
MQTELDKAIELLFDAKRAEETAKADRISAEEAIASLVDGPETGAKTVAGGNGVKVTVTRGLTYKADVNGIRAINSDLIPIKLTPAKYALDDKAYNALSETNPTLFAEVAQFVTSKPKKTSVTLKM